MKYERVYLYPQTLLLKMQLVPMEELFCHCSLPSKVRYINKSISDTKTITKVGLLQAVLVIDTLSTATVS